MGLFDRFHSTSQGAGHTDNNPGMSEQDATHLIEEGHQLQAQGRLDEAMQRYVDAVRRAPNPARAHLNRGNVLLLKGDLPGALDAFHTALLHKPDYAGAYYNIGNALTGHGRFGEGAENYRKALEINPEYAEAHCSLGIALKEIGQLDEATASFSKALQVNPALVEAHYGKGLAFERLGKFQEALASFRDALKLNPSLAVAYYGMGLALDQLGRFEEAAASYQHATGIKSDYAEAYSGLGLSQHHLGMAETALANTRRALELKPDLAEAHNNLCIILNDLHQYENAAESCCRALEIKPDLLSAYINLGIAQENQGLPDTAVNSYKQALEIRQDNPEAHYNLGMLLISLGRFEEAWPEFEWRYNPDFLHRPSFLPDLSFPQWQGENLSGKSILIWPEQGYGDLIQFARYFPMLKHLGAIHVSLVCRPPLIALFERADGLDEIIPFNDKPAVKPHDYWSFQMSLPYRFNTLLETIPSPLPYLAAPSDRVDHWRKRLPEDGLKVGLVWKGNPAHKNDANRSLPGLATLAPLWSVHGITFISLQKGQGEDEAMDPPDQQPLLHLGSDLQDFADTAAVVSQLDLVICIDSAIAHLTGALNKPCWVLLPSHHTDWRWLRNRNDSPWYPEVLKLFRMHSTQSNWASTINEVTQSLLEWAQARTYK